MRTYSIDQLEKTDMQKIAERFVAMGLQSSMAGFFWLPVPLQFLTPTQQEHAPECGPYSLGLELTDDAVQLELLVRATGKMRCECVTFASSALREHMIAYLESQLMDLGISF